MSAQFPAGKTSVIKIGIPRPALDRFVQSRRESEEAAKSAQANAVALLSRGRGAAIAAVATALVVFGFDLVHRIGVAIILVPGLLAAYWIACHAESFHHDARARIIRRAHDASWDVLLTAIQGGNQFILLLRNFDSEYPTLDRTPDGANPVMIPSGSWLAPLLEPLRAATPIVSLLNARDEFPEGHVGLPVRFDGNDWFVGFKGLATHAGLVLVHVTEVSGGVSQELDWLQTNRMLRKTVCLASARLHPAIASRYGGDVENTPLILEVRDRQSDGGTVDIDVPNVVARIFDRAVLPAPHRHFGLRWKPPIDREAAVHFTLMSLEHLPRTPAGEEATVSIVELKAE